MDLTEIIADVLYTGARAADRFRPCSQCGAESGDHCVSVAGNARVNHSTREPGDPVLSFVLRAMADRAAGRG